MHGLGRIRHRLGLPARNVEEPAGVCGVGILRPAEEQPGRVGGLEDLGWSAPTHARALLEDADRVAVAVVQIAEAGLLSRGGESHDEAVLRHAEGAPHGENGARVCGHFAGECHDARRCGGHDGGGRRDGEGVTSVDDARPGEVVGREDGLRGHTELCCDLGDGVTARDRVRHRGAAWCRGRGCLDDAHLAGGSNGCHARRSRDGDGLAGVDDARPGQSVGAQQGLCGEPERRSDAADRVALLDCVAARAGGGDRNDRGHCAARAQLQGLAGEDHGLPTQAVESENGCGGQAITPGDARDGVSGNDPIGRRRGGSDGRGGLRQRSRNRVDRGPRCSRERVADALTELQGGGPRLFSPQVGGLYRAGHVECHRHCACEHDRDGVEETAGDPAVVRPAILPSAGAVVVRLE